MKNSKRSFLIKYLRQCLVILSTVLLASCFDLEADGVNPGLRVMTYNISHGQGTDKIFDLDRLGAVIASQMPDLVALQEVDNATGRSKGVDQAATIAAAAGMPHVIFGRAIDFDGGEYGVAILSRYPFSFSGVEQLPTTAGFEQRVALWVVVEAPLLGEVLFVSTHLEAYFLDQDRDAQATRLTELFAVSPVTPAGTALPENVIVAGDLNADEGSTTIAIVAGSFDDTFTGANEATFPSGLPASVYDWVFAGRQTPLQPRQSWVLDEQLASDHRPVVIDFSLR